MNEKIYKGQKLFLEPRGNIKRYGKNGLKEGTIVSIKRKYFYVEIDGSNSNKEKFEIETLLNVNEDCNSEWIIWFSQDDFYKNEERNEKLYELRKLFTCYNTKRKKISYEDICSVYEILKKYMKYK